MCCIMGYAGHDLPKETFTEYLLRTTSRGPDDQRVAETEFGLLGFGRLAIMGLTPEGMQPFFRGADCVACNGELYGFRPVKAELEAEGYTFESAAKSCSSLPATPLASARCSTATARAAISPLPPRPKTSLGCAKRSIRSPSAATTATASLCATATSPIPRPTARMNCLKF